MEIHGRYARLHGLLIHARYKDAHISAISVKKKKKNVRSYSYVYENADLEFSAFEKLLPTFDVDSTRAIACNRKTVVTRSRFSEVFDGQKVLQSKPKINGT